MYAEKPQYSSDRFKWDLLSSVNLVFRLVKKLMKTMCLPVMNVNCANEAIYTVCFLIQVLLCLSASLCSHFQLNLLIVKWDKDYIKHQAGNLPSAHRSKAVSVGLTLLYPFSGPLPFMSIQVRYPNKRWLLREFWAKPGPYTSLKQKLFCSFIEVCESWRDLGKMW